MAAARRKVWLRAVVLALLLYSWGVGIANLDRFPRVHEDEAWIAAPGYTFWEKGYFGTTLFAGLNGMEQHYYPFPPLFSLLVGAALQLVGMGLFQARIVPLIFTLLTLALTYRLGAVLLSPLHGLLALMILMFWRVAHSTTFLATGIPLMDIARVARYDIAVSFFGLLALFLLLQSRKLLTIRASFLVGVSAGLAVLSHFYGAVWLPPLLFAIMFRFRHRAVRPILILLTGFGLTLVPWLLFVLSGWQDFISQFRGYSPYFNVFDPNFYAANWLHEKMRYQPFLDGLSQTLGASCGLALVILGLVWLTIRHRASSNRAFVIVITLIVLMILFALTISVKTFTYLVLLWPLLGLIAASGWVALWHSSAHRIWRLAFILISSVIITEGLISTIHMQQVASETTPYRVYTRAIDAYLPLNRRILALQHYWFGLAPRTPNYRSFLAVVNLTNPQYVRYPITFAAAADISPPQFVLLDQNMNDFLSENFNPRADYHYLYTQIWTYLNRHHAHYIGEVSDPAYGKCVILALDDDTGQ
jgi:4-amino-4-deoxy-L-arabinose transferase-like glycosyltransferase